MGYGEIHLPFDHSIISRLLSVSILVSWYKNSGTVFVVGTEGTINPEEGERDSVLLSAIFGGGSGCRETLPMFAVAVGNDG